MRDNVFALTDPTPELPIHTRNRAYSQWTAARAAAYPSRRDTACSRSPTGTRSPPCGGVPMLRPLFRALIAAVLLAGLLGARASRADLLVNGNFEQGPSISSLNPLFNVAPGNTALTGWTVSGGTIDIVTDNYWVPLSGHRSVVLSSTGPGAIEQAF